MVHEPSLLGSETLINAGLDREHADELGDLVQLAHQALAATRARADLGKSEETLARLNLDPRVLATLGDGTRSKGILVLGDSS